MASMARSGSAIRLDSVISSVTADGGDLDRRDSSGHLVDEGRVEEAAR